MAEGFKCGKNALDIITHNAYISFIGSAKWVKGVSPIFSPDYPVFEELVKKGINTQLIVTESVWEKVIEAVSLEDIGYYLSKGCLDIFLAEG